MTETLNRVRCNADCIVEYGMVDANALGYTIVRCTQNPKCSKSFCYHCKNEVHVASSWCARCMNLLENANPEAYNRYFYNEDLLGKHAQQATHGWSHLLKNKDISVQSAVRQIEELLLLEKMTPKCFRCGVHMFKTSMCNELTHCGTKTCYVCGRTTSVGGRLEINHWDGDGCYGCPRFRYRLVLDHPVEIPVPVPLGSVLCGPIRVFRACASAWNSKHALREEVMALVDNGALPLGAQEKRSDWDTQRGNTPVR